MSGAAVLSLNSAMAAVSVRWFSTCSALGEHGAAVSLLSRALAVHALHA